MHFCDSFPSFFLYPKFYFQISLIFSGGAAFVKKVESQNSSGKHQACLVFYQCLG